MTDRFSVRTSKYQEGMMLNICDADLLGSRIPQDGGQQGMHISESYYGGETVSRAAASELLRRSSIINMVGTKTVSLAIELGIGSRDGARVISDVPFMLVFKM